MARLGKYGIINIVMHPHEPGSYRRLFESVGEDSRGVRFHGDEFATISPISSTLNGVFSGRLAIWTEIDPNSNLIDKESLKEKLLSDTDIRIPDNVGFNSKVFSFAFREVDHRRYIETINDEGRKISINRARLAIEKVLRELKGSDVESLDAFVASQANAIDQVFSIEKMKKLEILLELPNPDDLSEDKQKILDEIDEMHAKKMNIVVTKRAGAESLEPSDRLHAMAELAKDNGFVKATGKDIDGATVERSTKEYPAEIEIELAQDSSRAAQTRTVAERGGE